MTQDRTAHFFFRPRRMSDLQEPHLLEKEHPYHIIQQVNLSFIDFENFSEDLLADRAFLDSFQGPQSENGVYRRILVRCSHFPEEILVVPKDGFVQLAALRHSAR